MTSIFILLAILAALIAYSIFNWLNQRRVVKTLSQEEFIEGYRKSQLIDVREPSEFEGGHILGARNIPLSQLKTRLNELRADKPVYLYCQSGLRSGRAGQMLHRKGYKELYHLKGGFKQWSGKIKRKN
ncbi:rhodanese-like domain-containing protein [Peribacillus glennii]|uniref:Rhodanese-like domain-containing protein n=1 Tax=Peribacillus glennii TaxID=2303991 RepID=A0A372LH96_9BACI|nr:rhodanese-like domain-containing protein [Peribacillus glennii]RFU65675.1 rhodanese-like domain-containing protein [Peribacillus glennii]